MAGIKRLGAITGPRLTPKAYASLGVDHPDKPDFTRRIPGPFIRKITRAPLLTQVQYLSDNFMSSFPSIHSRDPAPFSIDSAILSPPSEWDMDGSRGMLIRTYTSPLAKGDFYHVRILTRTTSAPNYGVPYVGARRKWHEHVAYMDRIVPLETFLKVYELNGEPWDWIEGGRGLSLKREAWDLLDAWLEVTDASEWGFDPDEDEEMSTGSEDEMDDEEDEDYEDDDMGGGGGMGSDDGWETEGSGVSMDYY